MEKASRISTGAVKIFKIANRRGYAALCRNNLTEGSTPLQAYERMRKALKRCGGELPDISRELAERLVRARV